MAAKPPDFKVSGIRAERIIASGSDSNPKLYIIGKDAAGNDGITVDTNDLILSGDGTDTWLFISGGIGNNNKVTFGGDVYISGTLTAAAGGGSTPGGANTEVQFNNAGSFSGSSGLRYIASSQTLVVANLTVTGTSTIVTSSNLVISDPLIYLASGSKTSNQDGGIAIASGSSVTNQSLVFGRVANDVWGVGRQDVAAGTSTSLTSMTLTPLRAAAIQVGGSVAVLTSSDGTTVTLSGSSVQLKANATDGVKFYENGAEHLQFTMNGGSSALIRATEVAYPSLYLSGQQVHLDASSGQIWFGEYATERLLVDTSDPNNPALVAKLASGTPFPLTLSGSGVAIGSNDGTTSFKKGTTTYLRAIYNGVNDVSVSAQTYNVNFGSQGFAAVSGSTITLNSSNGIVLQRDGKSYNIITNDGINTRLSASNSLYISPGASGSLFVSGTVIAPRLTGSLTRLVDGSPYLLAGPNITITTSSNGSIQITGSAGGAGSSYWDSTTANITFTTGSAYATFLSSSNGLHVTGSVRINGSLTQGSNSPTATGITSHAEGYGTTASGNYSHAEGDTNTASGIGSHAEGYQTTASGNWSHAEGRQTVSGPGGLGHAEGDGSTASGIAAHAEGTSTVASGQSSHSEGESTTASGIGSHAEGSQSTAAGYYSHAEGYYTQTKAYYAHSEGYLTIASGSYSHAAGIGTITSGSGQNVVGNYNKRNNSTSLFVIGDGTGDADAQRSDIVRVNSGSTIGTGRVEITGSLVATLGISGSLTALANGSPYLLAGPNITITTSSNGSIQITGSAGGGGSSNWNELSPSPRLNTTASVALAGGLGSSYAAQSSGNNVHFFVSGTIGSSPTIASTGVSLFNGDVATSGSIHLVTGSYQAVVTLNGTSTAADLEIRNRTTGGSVIHSVRSSMGPTVNFLEAKPNGSQENTKVSIMRSAYAGSTAINPYNTSDTNFFVGGVAGSKNGSTGGTSVFGGDLVISGSTYVGTSNTDSLVINSRLSSNLIPTTDRFYDLGSPTQRFANVYTGDLHLRNERGDYTLIEEEDCLTIRFNKTGKRYKFVLEPVPQYDEDPIVR